jgi:hypothetical protein
MDILKYSRGHFFGTLLPGAFLLLNILLIDSSIFDALLNQSKINLKDNQAIMLIAGFIFSYVIGIALRLLSPDFLERLALIVRIPLSFLLTFFDKIIRRRNIKTLKERIILASQLYPYSEWFFNTYLPDSSNQHREFYNNEFKNDIKQISRNFINNCKTFIYDSSPGLSEEIMYNEGLIRFICGIIYSLLLVLVLLFVHFSGMKELFFTYLILIIVFLYRLRGVRAKEAISVIDGYMFLASKK